MDDKDLELLKIALEMIGDLIQPPMARRLKLYQTELDMLEKLYARTSERICKAEQE